ncbi:hypothetical protein SAMN05421771_2664 [Granulicella pectinivorans]|uniref:Uncharacterized protein n=1 Tax=Granulicella pectinivorans TaxID=474950 RepID=A0A1I6MHR4_9BACT|nr:hypothetical protein SAMN05421771_2664 [Granulicella pectinivorans]
MKNVPSTGMWGGPRRLSGQTSGFESGIKYASFGAFFCLSVSWRSQGVTARRCENPHVSPEVFWTVKRGQMYGFCGQMCGEFVLKKVVCLCFDYRTGRGNDKINGPGRSPFLAPAVDVGLKPHSHPNGNNKATATATATARGCCALFLLAAYAPTSSQRKKKQVQARQRMWRRRSFSSSPWVRMTSASAASIRLGNFSPHSTITSALGSSTISSMPRVASSRSVSSR